IAVVCGNGELGDACASVEQLDDDLRVEVEVVGVQAIGDAAERLHRVDSIAAVELREAGAEEEVLDPREDPVTDELVEGHSAAQSREPVHHATPEDGVRHPLPQRPHEAWKNLGGVLPVAVEHGDEVEALGYRIRVADLLIASVPAIEPLTDQG